MTTFRYTIAGIPCQIQVTRFESQRGTFSYHASCPDDYYGYTDADYVVLDRKGYKAQWLADKITDAENDRIIAEIVERVEEDRAEAQIYRRYG